MSEIEQVINDLVEHIEGALAVDSDYVDCVRTDLLQAAVGYLKFANAQQWTRFKDKPPKEYGNYIAVVNGEATECTYSGPFIKGIITGWSTCEADGMKWLRDEQVTYWQPMPEPPKEAEHAAE